MEENDIKIQKILEKEFNLQQWQAENTLNLIRQGNTIPFIARYRKEKTGSLSDDVLREFSQRLAYLDKLEERRSEVIRLIDEQGKLTDELKSSIENALTMSEIEDLYRPYKAKRRTRASIAREKGLEPLAELIFAQTKQTGSIDDIALAYINEEKGVASVEDALQGAMDIIAENISNDADFRKSIRHLTIKSGSVVSKAAKEEDSVYRLYYDFSEPVTTLPPHRILAINRGEKEGFLSVKLNADDDSIIRYLENQLLSKKRSVTSQYVSLAAQDAYKRLIAPSIATEVRNMLTEEAEAQSVKLFGKNLSALLLQPPVKGKVVMGFDPGYRTGCKIAVVSGSGSVLDTAVAYCTLPDHDKEKAKKLIKDLIEKYKVDIISIGNGTASKESEIFISELIKELDRKVYYVMTNEAGASVYSASSLASEEFPQFDVSLRSAVSIARRLQDPLAELVKIEPKAIGVGQYQHDMNQKHLDEALGGVVEDCVNSVGVDLNTASPSLLSYVAGINKTVAKNIVSYREETGIFKSRQELKKVPKLGAKSFEQCAGFLRIADGKNVLDNTSVHPESYKATKELLKILGYTEKDVADGKIDGIKARLSKQNLDELSEKLGIGKITITDIADSLLKKGRDPREELPQPVLRTDVMSIDDLKPDMIMTGTVRNVIDFGAFVDIGVHQDGLVHISEICERYIKHPSDVLSVGDIIKVKILSVDPKTKRIGLSMKNLGN